MTKTIVEPLAKTGNGPGPLAPKMMTLEALADQAIAYLVRHFREGDSIHFAAIDGEGRHSRTYLRSDTAKMRQLILGRFNRANLYYCPNPVDPRLLGTDKAARDHDVVSRRWMFCDHDVPKGCSNPVEWQREILDRHAEFRPTKAIDSGSGGVHAYYELIHDDLDGWITTARINKVCDALGSDSMGSPAHLARLPYTFNLPQGRKRAEGRRAGLAKVLFESAVAARRFVDIFEALQIPPLSRDDVEFYVDPIYRSEAYRPSQGPDVAPSFELFTQAVGALPNGPGFTDYNGHYIRGTFALVGSLLHTGFLDDGLPLVAEWQGRYGAGDPAHDAYTRSSASRDTRTGWRHVLRMLREFDEEEATRITKAARRLHKHSRSGMAR